MLEGETYGSYFGSDPTGLWELVDDMQRCQTAAAEAEAGYRAEEAKKTLELKASGMAVGIIDKVLRGDDKVNMALLRWRCAEAEFQAAKEAVNVRKIEVKQRNEVHSIEYRTDC